MTDDPIVTEVRRVRDEYARQFNYDIRAMCDDLRKKQQQLADRVVSWPPRPPKLRTKRKQ